MMDLTICVIVTCILFGVAITPVAPSTLGPTTPTSTPLQTTTNSIQTTSSLSTALLLTTIPLLKTSSASTTASSPSSPSSSSSSSSPSSSTTTPSSTSMQILTGAYNNTVELTSNPPSAINSTDAVVQSTVAAITTTPGETSTPTSITLTTIKKTSMTNTTIGITGKYTTPVPIATSSPDSVSTVGNVTSMTTYVTSNASFSPTPTSTKNSSETPTVLSDSTISSTEKDQTQSTKSTTGTCTSDHEKKTNMNSEDSTFGKYGLPIVVVLAALCIILLIIIIVLLLHRPRQKSGDIEEDANMPRLKMLEVKETNNRHPVLHDDLHTYSLDYEKRVHDKIEEHKRSASVKDRPPVAPKPGAGVSTFMLAKKASLRSTSSSGTGTGVHTSVVPVSPVHSPTLPEVQPLIPPPPPDDEDAVVFNFNAKRPSDLLTTRRTSNLDGNPDRRKSSAKGGNSDMDIDV